MVKRSRIQIAVIGAGEPDEETLRLAEEVGRLLAERGAIVATGGLGGVMEAACRGARKAGGMTVGIIPGVERDSANAFVDVVIPSGMGEMRNTLVALAGDAVIALPGKFGTLSEIAFALVAGKPVVSLGSWDISPDVKQVGTPKEAVDVALSAVDGAERS